MDAEALNQELAGMDIYLLDQVLKGRFAPGSRILDAGCGAGRNLAWFGRNGFEVFGIDTDAAAIARVRDAGIVPAEYLVAGSVTALPWPDAHFQGVICNALLHVLPSRADLEQVVAETWRVLAPGGVWFTRVATSLSMEQHAIPLEDGRYRMPGTRWDILLLSLEEMLELTQKLGAKQLEPIKTVNVQNQRAMATWVLQK
ncbi:MAG: class I SAM-dependent methyltransferase [Planctomycetota bacterium]|nr:class I SAM-dependent methyltransferase [Planctomycetota bacterium]